MHLRQNLRQFLDTESVHLASKEMNEPVLKLFILGIFSIVNLCLAISFTIFYLFAEQWIGAAVGGASIAFFATVTYIIKKTENRKLAANLLISSTALILLYFFVSGGVFGTEFIWYFIFPAMALFIFGLRKGSYFVLSHLVISLLSLFIPQVNNQYEPIMLLTFVGAYITVFVLSFSYEYVRTAMRRRFRHSLEQLEKTVKANRAKNDFIADLSQQIRTPLHNISGIVEILHDSTSLTRENVEMLDTVTDSVNSLVKVVGSIVQVAEVRFDPLRGKVTTFSIYDLMDSICETVKAKHPKNLKLNCIVAESFPEKLTGQPQKLGYMVEMFFEKVCAITSNELTSQIDVIKLRDTANAVEMQFKVAVHGLKTSKVSKVGETQAVYDYSKNQNQTELDLQKLSINKHEDQLRIDLHEMKKVVESFGGSLGVKVDKKQTNFWFSILLWKTDVESKEPEVALAETKKTEKKLLSDARVLVVEDNPLNQKVISLALRKQVKDVVVASGGKEALNLFTQSKYDLVLMDLHMPIMDGYQTASKIREIEVGSNAKTPIVALTANAMRGTREKCIEAGMVDYVSKPFQVEKLLAILQSHL